MLCYRNSFHIQKRCKMGMHHISTAHYFGPGKTENDPSVLRVKLNSPELKTELMHRKGSLRTTKLFIREHLTPHQQLIFSQAKAARHHGILSSVYTKEGLIYTGPKTKKIRECASQIWISLHEQMKNILKSLKNKASTWIRQIRTTQLQDHGEAETIVEKVDQE